VGEFIEQILSEKKLAFAIFDHDLILNNYSPNFGQISQVNTRLKEKSIWDIFPELIGSEKEVTAVLTKSQKKYQLEKICKFTNDSARLSYYTLTLLPLKNQTVYTPQLLCIVADTTSETRLEQEIQQQKYEIELLQASLSGYGQYLSHKILGESEKVKKVRKFIGKIASIRNTTVLLQGESGTGKNLVARIIHQTSMPPKSPFVEINCASLPSTLLESEIFGYEKGAFTSAVVSKKGLLEEADGGTLFLDEIGELPHSLQAKFLTFLETKTFRRLGSTREKKVNIRVIASTNKDLEQAVKNNEFRQDLFYRLDVVTLRLPPLRELDEDKLIIAKHFVRLFALDFRKNVKGLTESAKAKISNYSWPGNVRELRNVIERAVIFAEGEKIDADEIILAEDKSRPQDSPTVDIAAQGITLVEIEKKLLQDALIKTRGNQSKAARLLGLTLDTFRYRIKKYNIPF